MIFWWLVSELHPCSFGWTSWYPELLSNRRIVFCPLVVNFKLQLEEYWLACFVKSPWNLRPPILFWTLNKGEKCFFANLTKSKVGRFIAGAADSMLKPAARNVASENFTLTNLYILVRSLFFFTNYLALKNLNLSCLWLIAETKAETPLLPSKVIYPGKLRWSCPKALKLWTFKSLKNISINMKSQEDNAWIFSFLAPETYLRKPVVFHWQVISLLQGSVYALQFRAFIGLDLEKFLELLQKISVRRPPKKNDFFQNIWSRSYCSSVSLPTKKLCQPRC